LTRPHNPITGALDHGVDHGTGTLAGVSEIGPHPNDLCPFRFSPVKKPDLPCGTVIDLRPIKERDDYICTFEMEFAPEKISRFASVPRDLISL